MKRFLKIGTGLFLLFLITPSCEKREIWLEPAEETTISSLKSVFEKAQVAFELRADKPDYSFRQDLHRTIHWDRSYKSDDGRFFIPVTLSLQQEHLRFSNGKNIYPYQTVLMVDPRGKEHQHTLLTFLSDGSEASRFTGTLLFEDYFRGNVQMAKFEEGISINFKNGNIQGAGLKMSVEASGSGVFCYWHFIGTVCVLDLDYGGAPEICGPRYEYICIGTPPDIPDETYDPDVDGGGSSGGAPGGDNESTVPVIAEIINQINDPCLKNTVDKAIIGSHSILGVISDIIKNLDADNIVQIYINEGSTVNNTPGQAGIFTLTRVGSAPVLFTGPITLNSAYMSDVSQEGVIAVLIHEILHAYISKSELIENLPSGTNTQHHQIFADNYITPMAIYLQQLFDISSIDAHALAWSGLSDLSLPNFIMIDGVQYSRSDLYYISANYYGKNSNGEHLAGTDKCAN